MILLVLVVLLWVAVLAPSAWRRFGERQGVGSIDHFHHQLQLLEHAGPKTVAPAYRLHTALPGDGSTAMAADSAVDSSRPKLVLLRPTDDAEAADVDGDDGSHYERVGVLDRPEPVCLPEVSVDRPPSAASRRDDGAPRCCAAWAAWRSRPRSSGCSPAMHLAWVFTGLSGLAALGLVGLMAYAKELEAEQARRRSRASSSCARRRPRLRRLPRSAGTTTTSRCRRPQRAEGRRSCRPRHRRGRSGGFEGPTILGPAGGVAQLVERYVRNVEAEGSSPFTSTKCPGHRAEVDPPQRSGSLTCLYVSLRGREESADERDVSRF